MILSTIMAVRNWMFDHGWLPERRFTVPVVCIGNLAVGGTGKTPHTEWIVDRLLEDGRRVAILSRGYGRRTKGFVEASPASRAEDIGDEPLQMYCRYAGRVPVCVSEDRCVGIDRLLVHYPETQIVLLDDAFQHRYVRPSKRLLLTDYNRLYTNDRVMPWGRLREKAEGAKRADVIIVTKCPSSLTEEERKTVAERLHPAKHQQIVFTKMDYEELAVPRKERGRLRCMVIAAIAHPKPLLQHLNAEGFNVVQTLTFRDHHNFTAHDIEHIEIAAEKVDHIITTAKDYARLSDAELSEAVRQKIIVQRIHVVPLTPFNPLDICQ